MDISINKPNIITITDSLAHKTYFGADQVWYEKNWNKQAGCGPTCAANITAYLAQTREDCKNLFQTKSMERKDFVVHMDELFRYVTPGTMGVNRTEQFIEGMMGYAQERSVTLKPHVLSVDNFFLRKRNVLELASFVKEGLTSDCPLAFLNLSQGEENRLQPWHWITITSAQIEENRLLATASDEGRKIEFDLQLWYLTTRMHGGLIYFTS